MKGYCLRLNNYQLIYTLEYPTKISDFDYDLDNPQRRFISTLLHTLFIYDKISNIELLNIKFSTDTCYQIIYALKTIIDNNRKNKLLLLSVKNVYINDMMIPSILAISKLNDNIIKISALNNISDYHLNFNIIEIQKIIELLKYEI